MSRLVCQAQATYAGMTALLDRQALADMFTPMPDQPDLAGQIARHEGIELQATLSGARRTYIRSVTRALFAAHRGAQGGRMPTESAVARYGVALRSYPVRDALWLASDDGRLPIGQSSATGSPLRVTTKLSPAATAPITLALSLRSSRCAIVLAINKP